MLMWQIFHVELKAHFSQPKPYTKAWFKEKKHWFREEWGNVTGHTAQHQDDLRKHDAVFYDQTGTRDLLIFTSNII